MRMVPWLGGVAVILALGGRSAADPTAPTVATIQAAEADVRSGASDDPRFYPTNRLHQGDRVQVLKQRPDGWLEIRPPEGSFSWVNERFLTQPAPNVQNYVVVVPAGSKLNVLMGSELVNGRPQVVSTTLERSSQVRRFQGKNGQLGQTRSDIEGTWLPIFPPDAEVRYLRVEAVLPTSKGQTPPVNATNVAKQSDPGPIGSSFTPTPVPPGVQSNASAQPTHAELDLMYQKAVAADRAGNTVEAARLYAQVGALGLPINHQYAPEAISRANYLLANTGRVASTINSRPIGNGDPGMPPSVQLAKPLSPLPSATDSGTATTQTTFTTSRQPDTNTAGCTPWTGRLRRAGRGIDNRPTYVLEGPGGRPLMYANPGRGVDLESHVGQNVELLGNPVYYGELRANYMTVAQVRVVQ